MGFQKKQHPKEIRVQSAISMRLRLRMNRALERLNGGPRLRRDVVDGLHPRGRPRYSEHDLVRVAFELLCDDVLDAPASEMPALIESADRAVAADGGNAPTTRVPAVPAASALKMQSTLCGRRTKVEGV